MDKLLFFFHRKPGLTRAEFSEHYLDVHAPLGLRLTRTMAGYTVNLTATEGDDGPDAVTEVWTESMADFFDPGRSFATPDDAAQLMADHDSFIGPYDTYVVEERVVRDGGDAPSLDVPTPGVKRIECFLDGEAVPEPGRGVTRVVEHRVVQALDPDAPPYVAIVSTWAPTHDALGPSTATATLVREYRQLLTTA